MLLVWILLLAGIVVWLRLRERVARLEERLSFLEAGRVLDAPPPVAEPLAPPVQVEQAVQEAPEPFLPPAEAIEPAPRVAEAEEPAESRTPERGFGFEDLFGRHLPIWAGGITLVVAGVLIVRYSIEAGLLTPPVRVIAGLAFGTGLIAAAEVALRRERWVRDPRIGQSLSGAGLATLYASILIAANLYHLIGPMTAFAGLAGVTLLAAGLSLRYGAPSAVLGLVGGLAAPAMVGAESPNVPLLATYLALIVGGLSALGRTQRWWWLGALAIAGGFGWGLLLVLGGLAGIASALSVGMFTLLLAVGFPLLLTGGTSPAFRLAAALAGCAQMAALVATGGFAGLHWALFGLIAGGIVWLSRREKMLADAPLTGIATGLLLAFAWPSPDPTMLAAVLGGGALIHGAPALLRLWRTDARRGDAVQIVIAAAGVALAPLVHFDGVASPAMLAALALLGAAMAGGAAALGWGNPGRGDDARFAMLSLTAIVLALLAAALVIDEAALAPAAVIAAAAALLLARRAEDTRVEIGGQLLATLGLLLLLPGPGERELLHASGHLPAGEGVQGLVRWLVPALAALGFARWSAFEPVRRIAAGAVPALAYVAFAQLLPAAPLALIPAAMIVALAFMPVRRALLAAPLGVAGLIALGWATLPLLQWLAAAGGAMLGFPFLATVPSEPGEALVRIGAPLVALAVLRWRQDWPELPRTWLAIVLAALGVIAAHIVWKQVFAIGTAEAFVAYGMAERTLWEIVLLAGALAAWRIDWRRTATGLAIAALLHFAWFTGVLHNPLWSVQAVGPWLVPAYVAAWAASWLAARLIGDRIARRAQGWVQMALILLLAGSALRQIFEGQMLALAPVAEAEDICRSLLALLLALGFLHWGIARENRDWRLVSLVLMLGAVGKVFLFDAAGLDGLMRIGSFVALGFSLILVGWLYSRFLPDAQLTRAQNSTDSLDVESQG
jgi:uncharacterized membrane protein